MTCRPVFSGALIGIAAMCAAAAPNVWVGTLSFLALSFGVYAATRFPK